VETAAFWKPWKNPKDFSHGFQRWENGSLTLSVYHSSHRFYDDEIQNLLHENGSWCQKNSFDFLGRFPGLERLKSQGSSFGNDRVKVTHCDHGIMTRSPTPLFSFRCLSPRYLEALKEKTTGSLLRYQTGPKWVTFALAKSFILHPIPVCFLFTLFALIPATLTLSQPQGRLWLLCPLASPKEPVFTRCFLAEVH